MSGTDDGDGGIDKESLREELREKYEEEEKKRKSTQRMSDLLLKGATMTNTHCGTCGDPIFRQNGTNFCPTCHGGPEGVEASVGDDSEGGTESGAADAESADTGEIPADERPQTSTADGDVETATATPDARSFEQDRSPTNQDVDRPGTEKVPRRDRDRGRGGSFDAPEPSDPQAGDDLDAARESLATALERFAREAATADDPRYARECLEAAREAADALAAMRR